MRVVAVIQMTRHPENQRRKARKVRETRRIKGTRKINTRNENIEITAVHQRAVIAEVKAELHTVRN
jgi:hypothetical protein